MAPRWLPKLGRKPRPASGADASPSGDDLPPFRAMTEGTPGHWRRIAAADQAFAEELPDRVLAHLALLRSDTHGFAVDRLEHALQTATRAHRDGRDEEYVTCALLHDVGAALAPADHAAFAAMILKPYVSKRNHWMVRHHDVFQGYHFFHLMGANRHARDRFRFHPHYGYAAEFCDLYDQAAFDPDYQSMTLADFEPLVRGVLGKRR